jgi:hypothetical protein
MYKAIRALPPLPEVPSARLAREGTVACGGSGPFSFGPPYKVTHARRHEKRAAPQFRWGWQRREMSPGGEYLGQGMFERTAHAASS